MALPAALRWRRAACLPRLLAASSAARRSSLPLARHATLWRMATARCHGIRGGVYKGAKARRRRRRHGYATAMSLLEIVALIYRSTTVVYYRLVGYHVAMMLKMLFTVTFHVMAITILMTLANSGDGGGYRRCLAITVYRHLLIMAY